MNLAATLSTLATATFLFATTRAQAAASYPDCTEGASGPVVHVEMEVPATALAETVIRELAAAVARDGFVLCPADSTTTAVARLRFRAVGQTQERIEIHAEDRMTDKHLMRTLDLRNFPDDSRALAVAVAGTELLRASWLELALPEAKPADDPPEEVTTLVQAQVERGGRRDRTMGVLPAFEIYGAGERLWGADLFFSTGLGTWLGKNVSWDIALGGRRGLAQESAHGQIQTSALTAWTGLTVGLLHAGRFVWTGSVAAAGSAIRMEGLAAAGAQGDTGIGYAAIARAGTGLQIETGSHLVWSLGVAAGIPVLGVGGVDQDQRVTGVAGLEISTRLGAGVRF